MNVEIALHAPPQTLMTSLTAIRDLTISVEHWAPPRATVVVDEVNCDALLALLDPSVKTVITR